MSETINKIPPSMLNTKEFSAACAPLFRRAAEHEAANIMRWKDDLKLWGWKPPTRLQKIKARLLLPLRRIREAWLVLIGKMEAV